MPEPAYRLYHYWRSSSSWRVRLACAYKGITFEPRPVSLLDGESESAEHLARNPAGFVPVVEILEGPDQGALLTESLAIIRYLEEAHPESPSLWPGTPLDHARMTALAEVINSGTHPLQNIPVFQFHSSDPVEQKRWASHFIQGGMQVFENLCAKNAGRFAYGDSFSIADTCLIPQIYNAIRYEVSVEQFATIHRLSQMYPSLPYYQETHPDQYKPGGM